VKALAVCYACFIIGLVSGSLCGHGHPGWVILVAGVASGISVPLLSFIVKEGGAK
jgi:hypothetical protein